MKPFKKFHKKLNENNINEDGGGSAAAGIGGGGSGEAPTNSVMGLGSEYSPDGKIQSPPVSKKTQKKIRLKNHILSRYSSLHK